MRNLFALNMVWFRQEILIHILIQQESLSIVQWSSDLLSILNMIRDQAHECNLCYAVCGAPKRRFRAYQPPVTKDANNLDVRKQRKAQLQRDESIG